LPVGDSTWKSTNNDVTDCELMGNNLQLTYFQFQQGNRRDRQIYRSLHRRPLDLFGNRLIEGKTKQRQEHKEDTLDRECHVDAAARLFDFAFALVRLACFQS
jgi:hypothetical protein